MIKPKDKIKFLMLSLEVDTDRGGLVLKSSGNHNLTFEECKDTIRDAMEDSFEEFGKLINESKEEFKDGIVVLPLFKLNFKNQK